MVKSKLPGPEDYKSLLDENDLTEDMIEGVYVHIKTVNGAVIHWHYMAYAEMGKWIPVIT